MSSIEKPGGDRDDLAKKLQGRSRLKDKPPNKLAPAPNERASINIATLGTKFEPDNPLPPLHNISLPGSPDLPTVPQVSRDTPPPLNLKADTTEPGAFGTAGRATRRPRGSVSYAEPNLRAKMRRPTSDLIDAVGTVERSQHLSNAKLKENKTGPDSFPQESGAVANGEYREDVINLYEIQSSQGNNDRDNASIDGSTGAAREKNAVSTAEVPSSVIDRRRRTVGYQHTEEDGTEQAKPQLHPGAGSAIAALMAGRQRPRRYEEERKLKEVPAEAQGIYDLSRSSPADGLENDEGNRAETAEEHKITTSSRRHSSMPVGEGVDTDRDGNARLVVRRNERKRDTLGAGSKRDGATELKNARSAASLIQTEEAVMGRAERLAVRRRSMMI